MIGVFIEAKYLNGNIYFNKIINIWRLKLLQKGLKSWYAFTMIVMHMTILIIWWFVGAPIYQYNCQSLSLFQILPIYILNDCHKMYALTHRFFIHLIYLPRIVTFLFEIYSHLKFMYERLYVCKVLSLTSLDYARNFHLCSVVKPLN